MSIDLTTFCSRERDRSYLSAPFSFGGFTYATNGHMAVRVPLRENVPEGSQEQPRSIIELFNDAEAMAFAPFDCVQAPKVRQPTCEDCRGVGHVVECSTCEGEGEHECDNRACGCMHECGACDGKGVWPASSSDHDSIYCDACGGDGRKPDQRRVDFGGSLAVQWRYLEAIQSLPGPIEWAVAAPIVDRHWPDRVTYNAIAFRGPGWLACIMSVARPSNEAIQSPRELPIQMPEVA